MRRRDRDGQAARGRVPSAPPTEARDILRLAAIEAWRALASGEPAPGLDPVALFQVMHDTFAAGNGISPVEQLIEDWYEFARQCGINVNDEHGDLRPDIDEAITRTVTAATWFGVTAGYLTLAGSYHVPRRYLAAYSERTRVLTERLMV